MRKPTYLYAVGCELPELRWGKSEPNYPQWAIEKYGIAKVKRMGEMAFKGGGTDSSARISTPKEFRDLLLRMAQSVHNTGNVEAHRRRNSADCCRITPTSAT